MSDATPPLRKRKKKSRTWWILGGLLLLILILILFSRRESAGTEVAVDTVALHTITETVTASGSIYPETEVKIAPEVSGEITELAVAEGDSVRAGQLLLRINAVLYNSVVSQAAASVNQSEAGAANARQLVEQARSRFQLAQANYERSKDLLRRKYISQQEFDQAQSEYSSAEASYEAARASASGGQFGVTGAQASLSQARENLRKTTVLAPGAGIISQLNVKQGERVVGTAQMAGTELLTIANMSRIEVRVDVSENDIAKVKIGDTAQVEAGAYPNRKFTGLVTRVGVSSKSGNSLTGGANSDQVSNYTVHILILPSSYADLTATLQRGQFVFKPGMSASVTIATRREREVLSVPINAVTTRDWADSSKARLRAAGNSTAVRQVVFVYNPQTLDVSLRDVSTGVQDDVYVQITGGGLRRGEQIISAPYGTITRLLRDKMKVRVVPKERLFEEKEEK